MTYLLILLKMMWPPKKAGPLIIGVIRLAGFVLVLHPVSASGQAAIRQPVLENITRICEENKTGRLLVSVRDSILTDHTFYGKEDELYRLYSVTKVFSGIAAGLMIQKGLIPGPEVKLARYFKEWENDPVKSTITLRHILQHTSGLFTNKGSMDIYDQPDYVAFALNDSVITTPGHTYVYNNRAINLISGLVNRITGLTLEQFIRDNLFEPLAISRYRWPNDPAGNSWGMDGLQLSARDLLKVGQLLCNYGKWKDRQLLPENWCRLAYNLPLMNAYKKVGGYGMCLKAAFNYPAALQILPSSIDTLQSMGLSPRLVNQLRKAGDSTYPGWSELGLALNRHFTADDLETISSAAAEKMMPLYAGPDDRVVLFHFGEIGQQLIFYPAGGVVAVRLIGEKWGRKTDEKGNYRYLMDQTLLPYLFRLRETF